MGLESIHQSGVVADGFPGGQLTFPEADLDLLLSPADRAGNARGRRQSRGPLGTVRERLETPLGYTPMVTDSRPYRGCRESPSADVLKSRRGD